MLGRRAGEALEAMGGACAGQWEELEQGDELVHGGGRSLHRVVGGASAGR